MYLGLSLVLLVGGGVLGARLLGLHSFWDRFLAAAVIMLVEVVLISLTVGLVPGGYRPLPLTLATAALFLVLLIAAVRTGRIAAPPLDAEERSYLNVMYLVILLTLPVWLWILFNGLLLPPVYWDDLYYHLVAPAVWTKAGQIHFFLSGNPFVAGYPHNLDLAWGWTMAMTGTDVWADLGGLPFVFIGLGAVLAFCRRLGIQPWQSFWAGLLFVTTPMVIFHAKAAYIDLPMSVLFGIAAYFLYLYATGGSLTHLVLGGAAMGLLVGAKYSGPYLAIAGLLPIIYQLRTAFIKRHGWFRALLWYGLPVLLLGAFWYVKNLVLYQNPLHPMRLPIGGVAIFGGRYDPDAFTFTKPENGWVTLGKALLDLEPKPLMDSFYAGFGPQLLLLALPATLLFLLKEPKRRWLMIVVWLLPLLISVATLPAKFPRYLIHLNLFLLPFAAWLLQEMNRWPARVIKTVTLSFVVYSVLIATPIFPIEPNAYRVGAGTIWAAHRMGYGSQHGPIQVLNDELGRPLRILTGPMRLTYSLLGERWQNELLYVEPTDEESWLKAVRNSGADLFWYEFGWDPVVEAPWVERHPELFQLYYSDNIVHGYWIRTFEGGER